MTKQTQAGIFETLQQEVEKLRERVEVLEVFKASMDLVKGNSKRAEVIKLAKDTVENLKQAAMDGCPEVKGNYILSSIYTEVSFEVDSEKGKVEVEAFGATSGESKGKEYAEIADGEVFNEDILKAVAICKIYGVEIPKELIYPAQPDEAVLGMSVEVQGNFNPYVDEVITGSGSHHCLSSIESSPQKLIRILDDSNAKY